MTSSAMQRFVAPLNQLNEILQQGRNQRDKGAAFYKNHGRDVLYKLEALSRVYKNISDKKFFEKWNKHFKSLEDALGLMDYNDAMNNEFSGYKELKKSAEKKFGVGFQEASLAVSIMLKEEGWISGERTDEFVSGLNEVHFKDGDVDRVAFANVVTDEMDKLVMKYGNGEIDPYDLEGGLHEFRRRLRWVSIYAQVSNGLFQLRPIGKIPADLHKYCTREVVSSPFNKLPKPSKGTDPVVIQAHYFYALSWLIQYLGDMKDVGLRYAAFLELDASEGKNAALTKKFIATCVADPKDVATLAESAIDDFIYRDFIPERICRDIMRSIS